MHFFNLLGLQIPFYGLLIASGVLIANVIAYFILKKNKLDFYDFLIIESYAFLGGWFCAKVLYLILAFRDIDWSRVFEIKYLNGLLRGGFVFYGGLIGGLLFVWLAARIHKIEVKGYVNNVIGLLPIAHGMGRMGCHLVGCCYGIPYDGIGAIVYKDLAHPLAGIPLFPVQLVESFSLFIIAAVLIWLLLVKKSDEIMAYYFIMYGLLRFGLEYLRYHENRGIILFFSTSQWISIILVFLGVGMLFFKRGRLVKQARINGKNSKKSV